VVSQSRRFFKLIGYERKRCASHYRFIIGQGSNGTPGLSNKALSRVVARLAKKFNLPVIAQWEIADCIPELFKSGNSLIIHQHRDKGQYLDTYEVLYQAKIHCDEFGYKRSLIVAHPDHVPRCAALAKKLGFEVAVADTSEVPYDPESIQEWTRSRKAFLEREKQVIEHYRQKGYL